MNTHGFHLPVLSNTKPPDADIILSPSQFSTWDECLRKGAFQYIAGIRSPPHKSAILGTLVHAHLEAWLSRGVPPGREPPKERNGKPINAPAAMQQKAIAVAGRMIHYLPPPGIATVERNFYFTTSRGHVYTGFIDFSFDGRLYQVSDFPVPVIGDHKTTGNVDYMKTSADLHNDSQGVIYAVAGFVGFVTDDLLLFWNYGTTADRDAQVHPVLTRVYLPSVMEKFERVIEPFAAEIISYRRAKLDPNSFPPTLSACNNFGGCPHRKSGICKVSDQERMTFDMSTQQNLPPDMAARMAAYPGNGAQAGAPQFAPPPVYQQQPTNPVPQAPFAPPLGQYPQQLQPQQYTATPAPQNYTDPNAGNFGGQPQQPQFAPPPGQYPQPATAGHTYGGPQTGTPPQQPPQQHQLPFQAPPPAAAPYNPDMAPNPPEAGRQVVAAPPPPPAMPTPTEAEGAAATKKRGRPAGSPNKELTRDQLVFIEGAKAAMANPSFNGNIAMLIQGGEMMLAAVKAQFDKE